jgi:RHS repeat-associated protein
MRSGVQFSSAAWGSNLGRRFQLRLPGQSAEQFDMGANGFSPLSYNNARWYQPTWGKYTQPDPLGLSSGPNSYAYVDEGPISQIDPLGLYCLTDAQIRAVAAAAGGAVAGGLSASMVDPLLLPFGIIVGAGSGALFSQFNTATISSNVATGAALGANTGLNNSRLGAAGGLVGGIVTYGAQQGGAPDWFSSAAGSTVGGAAVGGLPGAGIGLAAGATADFVQAALKAGNNCPCGQPQ